MQASNGERFDIAVIGAGIAGASAAAELSRSRSVLLLEQEERPGYHTTGRSAALFTTMYGPPVIRALSRAAQPFFEQPPDGFAAAPLLGERGAVFVAREDQRASVEEMMQGPGKAGGIEPMAVAEVERVLPLLRHGYCAAGLYEGGARDIDVDALHQGYLRGFRARGGELRTNARIEELRRSGDRWHLSWGGGSATAGIVVNAAGAWADEVARLAGVAPVGLVPKRRTALLVAPPDGVDPAGWPMAVDIDEQFYIKPDAGNLLMSPADETPSEPCDCQPEEIDVAICVDRIETAFDLQVRRIAHKWAGLRSFVADKSPVAGFDARAEGFFWLAGQGGYGIQTAPALARTAAALALRQPVPDDVAAEGVSEAALSPARPGLAA